MGAPLVRSPALQATRVIKRSATAALLDGGQQNGMVVASRALDIAIDLARQSGVGVVGTCNTSSSTGAIGYYADRAARAGFVGATRR